MAQRVSALPLGTHDEDFLAVGGHRTDASRDSSLGCQPFTGPWTGQPSRSLGGWTPASAAPSVTWDCFHPVASAQEATEGQQIGTRQSSPANSSGPCLLFQSHSSPRPCLSATGPGAMRTCPSGCLLLGRHAGVRGGTESSCFRPGSGCIKGAYYAASLRCLLRSNRDGG